MSRIPAKENQLMMDFDQEKSLQNDEVAEACLDCDLFVMESYLKCRIQDGHPDTCGGPYRRLESKQS